MNAPSPRELAKLTLTRGLIDGRGLSEPAEIDAPEKYELLECVGRGGFGAVYKARDKALDRLVALKFLTEARRADVERFRREARFTARLNDPGIVQVYELGESEGQAYIAMQFMEGGSLADAKLDMNGYVRAIRSAAAALHHAHRAGLVHRDFKPGNVLLNGDGGAYLADFGIARDLDPARDATLSREGALIGTPALMAPEQARGELHAIDARTDVYAIGATLYLLLCGRYPFKRTNLVDQLHAVIHDEPPLPRSVNPNVPRALEAIILKCMHKQRSHRYASAAEVASDLDAYLSGKAVAGEPTAWFRKLVGAPPEQPSSGPDLFQTVGMDIAREIAAWDANLYRVSRNITRFHTQLDKMVGRLDEILRDHPECAWARFYRGVALFRCGKLDEALDEMERSIDRLAEQATAQFEMGRLYLAIHLREQNLAHQHISPAGTRWHLSETRSRLDQAVVALQEARRLKGQDVDWRIEFAEAVSRLADRDYDGCIAACDKILAGDPDLEDVWRLRGDAQRIKGDDPLKSYEQATRIRRSDYESYLGMADAHFVRGDLHQARECLRKVLDIYPDHRDALAKIGRAYLLEARQRPESDGRQAAERRRLIDAGINHSRNALAAHGGHYGLHVTHAELLIERARSIREAGPLSSALETLEAAKGLPGCQNRVMYLSATALLERIRIAEPDNPQRSEDLRRILELGKDAMNDTESDHWRTLIAAAKKEVAAKA